MKTENIDTAKWVTVGVILRMFRNRLAPNYGLTKKDVTKILLEANVPIFDGSRGSRYFDKEKAVEAMEASL